MAAGARGTDLLLTSGGASVGRHDLVQSALGDGALGADALKVGFWKIAMRPGKPLIFGHLGTMPLLGQPGNPWSTIVFASVVQIGRPSRRERVSRYVYSSEVYVSLKQKTN